METVSEVLSSNHDKEAPLRIDVTQHQMHAVILALRYAYPAQQ
jgi:hypothetical protein